MARARIRANNPVSLFPFLAVLMCAMGALILLLIVITRRVRQQALVRAAEATVKPAEPVPALPRVEPTVPKLHAVIPSPDATDRIMAQLIADVRRTDKRRRAELQSLRADYAKLIAGQKSLSAKLAAGEKKLADTRSRLLSVQNARAGLAKKSTSASNAAAALEAEIKKQVTALDAIRRKLQALKLKQAQTSSKFAIVPFDGRTGTTRRPIFIECTADTLRILPEGVEIKAGQLAGASVYENALLAGTQSLIQHWISRRRPGSDDPKPYVLLLVRPGGSVAYYAARKLLRDLDEPIGYELIEDEWDLKLPKADPRARAICKAAVDRSLQSRSRVGGLYARARRGGSSSGEGTARRGSTTGRQMRFNRATGRFEVIEPNKEPSLGPFGAALNGNSTRRNMPPGEGDRNGRGRSAPHSAARSQRNGPGVTGTQTTRPEWTAQPSGNGGTRVEAGNKNTGPGDGFGPRSPQRSTANNTRPGGHPDGTTTGPSRGGGDPKSPKDGSLWPLKKRPAGNGSRSVADSGSKTGSHPLNANGSTTGTAKSNSGASSNSQPQSRQGVSPFGAQRAGTSSAASKWRPRRRWGLSNPGATIGFEKEVHIQATADRLVIARQQISVGNGETKQQLLQLVVVAIAREVRAWGKPPASFYWVPRIRFTISPGGNRHYERIRSSLQDLGLQTSADYRLDSSNSGGITRRKQPAN